MSSSSQFSRNPIILASEKTKVIRVSMKTWGWASAGGGEARASAAASAAAPRRRKSVAGVGRHSETAAADRADHDLLGVGRQQAGRDVAPHDQLGICDELSMLGAVAGCAGQRHDVRQVL